MEEPFEASGTGVSTTDQQHPQGAQETGRGEEVGLH